jgi:hypothetical protein
MNCVTAFDGGKDGAVARAIDDAFRAFWFDVLMDFGAQGGGAIERATGRPATREEASWLVSGKPDGIHYAPHPWPEPGSVPFGPIRGHNEWRGGGLKGK